MSALFEYIVILAGRQAGGEWVNLQDVMGSRANTSILVTHV